MSDIRVIPTKGATYKCQFCMTNCSEQMVRIGEKNAFYCGECLGLEWWSGEAIRMEDERRKAIGFLASTITGEPL